MFVNFSGVLECGEVNLLYNVVWRWGIIKNRICS